MAKLVLFSVIIAMIGLPLFVGRSGSPKRGLQRTILLILAFNIFYVFAVRYIYPRLLY